MRFFSKEKDRTKPELWFAWYPVYACAGKEIEEVWGTVWLEYIWRFKYKNSTTYQHRLKEWKND